MELKSPSFGLPQGVDKYCMREIRMADKGKGAQSGGRALALEPDSPLFSC